MLSQPTESIPYARTVWLPMTGRVHRASRPVQCPFTHGSFAVWGMPARSPAPEIWFASIEHLLSSYYLGENIGIPLANVKVASGKSRHHAPQRV